MTEPSIRTVAVIGAGTAGRSFALACARSGFHVILEDVMPANLRRAHEQFEEGRHPERVPHSGTSREPVLSEGRNRGPSRMEPPALAFARHSGSHRDPESPYLDSQPGSLTTALTVEDAVRTAGLAIDFVPDELESKLEIFSMLDRMAPPRTILLTPTDAQSITDLASCTYRPTLCFALRNFTPPAPSSASALAPGSPTHLVHPPSADESALTAVAGFLQALAYEVIIAQDTIPPMLFKNQSTFQEPSS